MFGGWLPYSLGELLEEKMALMGIFLAFAGILAAAQAATVSQFWGLPMHSELYTVRIKKLCRENSR